MKVKVMRDIFSNSKICSIESIDEKCMTLIKILLWFCRILGLTFGGLTIDSNGRLFVNKYYKIYGYLFTIVLIIYDIYFFTYALTNEIELKKKLVIEHIPGLMNKYIHILFSSVGVLWYIFKLSILVYFNLYGFKLVETITKSFKNDHRRKRNFKVILVIILWFLQMTTLVIISVFNVDVASGEIMKFIAMIQWNITFTYSWTLASITWVISIYFSERLDKMRHNLVRSLEYKSGS